MQTPLVVNSDLTCSLTKAMPKWFFCLWKHGLVRNFFVSKQGTLPHPSATKPSVPVALLPLHVDVAVAWSPLPSPITVDKQECYSLGHTMPINFRPTLPVVGIIDPDVFPLSSNQGIVGKLTWQFCFPQNVFRHVVKLATPLFLLRSCWWDSLCKRAVDWSSMCSVHSVMCSLCQHQPKFGCFL